jgi:hypothetical protein
MDTRTALSRGGKDRLAATSGIVLKGQLTTSPALPPTANAIGVKVELSSGFDVGDRGIFVQQQNQLRSLAQVRGPGACLCASAGLGEKLLWEAGTIMRQWSRHATAPCVSSHSTRPLLFGNPTRICEMDH